MKIIRKENGISQKMMAEKLNLLPTAYSNYENHFTDIPVEIMQKFCKEIGCSMEDLIGFDLNKKKLPVSVTFRSEGEKMNVDFLMKRTKYDYLLDRLEEEMEKFQEEKIDKIQFRTNVKALLEDEKNYLTYEKKGLRELP